MPFLSYNEQIAICAQQENPFVQNKPYNPDQVFSWVVDHLLAGESPLTNEEVEHAKAVYTATIETLLEKDLPVTQANIIQLKDQIAGYAQKLLTESAAPEASATVDASAKQTPAQSGSPAASDEYFECQGVRIKKQWVKIAAVVVLVLLVIKILK